MADVVQMSGSGYIVATAHQSSVFETDRSAGRLTLLAERGTDGAIDEAPTDGETYGRKSGAWVVLPGSAGGMFRDRGDYAYAIATGPEANRYMTNDVVARNGRLWVAIIDEAGAETVGGAVVTPGGSMSDYHWICLTPFTGSAEASPTQGTFFAERLYVRSVDGSTLKTLPQVLLELQGITGSDAPADGKLYGRQDAEWAEIVIPEVGVEEASADGKLYGRKDETWVEIPTDDPGVEEAPADGKQYARQDEGWVEVEASGGSAPGAFINRGAFDPQKLDYQLNDVVDFEGRFWVCVVANTQEFPFFKNPNPGIQTVDWRCLTPMVGGENVERNGLNVIYGNSSLINDGMSTVSLATILQTMAQRIQALEGA